MPDECMGARVCIVLSFLGTKELFPCTLNQVFMFKKSCEFSNLRCFKFCSKNSCSKNMTCFLWNKLYTCVYYYYNYIFFIFHFDILDVGVGDCLEQGLFD
jgi:hypothetical protein